MWITSRHSKQVSRRRIFLLHHRSFSLTHSFQFIKIRGLWSAAEKRSEHIQKQRRVRLSSFLRYFFSFTLRLIFVYYIHRSALGVLFSVYQIFSPHSKHSSWCCSCTVRWKRSASSFFISLSLLAIRRERRTHRFRKQAQQRLKEFEDIFFFLHNSRHIPCC